MNVLYGHCIDTLAPGGVPLGGLRLLKDIGFRMGRLAIYFDDAYCASDPTKWQLGRIEHDFEVFDKVGMRMLANPMWLHRHITGGVPINERYAIWRGGPIYDDVRRRIRENDLPTVDSTAITEYGHAFGDKFGWATDWIAFWNEPDGDPFLPQKNQFGEQWLRSMRWFYDTIWLPFMRGYRMACPHTPIVGPDSMSPGNLELFLKIEAEYVATDPTWPYRYDYLAAHVYGNVKPPTIEDSCTTVNDYLNVLRRNKAEHRPFLATEYASDYDSHTPEWTAEMARRFPWIAGFFPYHAAQWLPVDENTITEQDPAKRREAIKLTAERQWDSGKFRMNDKARAMRKVIVPEWARKQRAIRS